MLCHCLCFQEQDDPKCPQGTVLSDAQAENFIGWPTDDEPSGTGKKAPPSLQQAVSLDVLQTGSALQEYRCCQHRSLDKGHRFQGSLSFCRT